MAKDMELTTPVPWFSFPFPFCRILCVDQCFLHVPTQLNMLSSDFLHCTKESSMLGVKYHCKVKQRISICLLRDKNQVPLRTGKS